MKNEDDLDDQDSPLSLVNIATRQELLDRIAHCLQYGEGFSVATLNLDHVVKIRKDPVFRDAYRKHSFVVADGNPIVWLRRLMSQPVELVPGSELVHPLCALAAQLNAPVALLGATEETLSKAKRHLEDAHPGLDIAVTIAPEMGFDPESADAERMLNDILVNGARLCFLALGAPKQERLAIRGQSIAPLCGFVSVGAGLDFIAETQTRAPKWVQDFAMEWLWRLVNNPRRLTKRYIACMLEVPGLAAKAISSGTRNGQSASLSKK